MSEFENKSNNDILLDIKQMEDEYEAIKQRIANDWDKLTELELKFDKANKELVKRLKPTI